MSNTNRDHNQGQGKWASQSDLHREIVGLERRFEKRFDEFAQTIHKSMSRLETAVGQAVNRTNQPTNWGWVIAAVLALGSFITLYLQPVKNDAQHNRAEIVKQRAKISEAAVEQAYQRGRMDEGIQTLKAEVIRLRSRP